VTSLVGRIVAVAATTVAAVGQADAQHPPAPYSDPEESLEVATALLADHPDSVALHLVVAREATALGVLGATKEERIAWLVRGQEAASAALALDSASAEVSYWLAATLGLHADEEGGRTKISLARQAYARTQRTLELDSLHAGANHVMGRLHAGARKLGWLNRMIARTLGFGEILNDATWQGAERHMRIAAERDPDQLVNLYELGRLLAEYSDELDGDPEEGRAILRDLASRSPRHALDALFIARSREALERLES
jgi:hypothetical protein